MKQLQHLYCLLFSDERERMKWHKAPLQDAPCVKLPSFPIYYVPCFKAGYLARMFTKGIYGGFVIGREIASTGCRCLSWPDGSRVDTEQLFRPVGWKGLY